MKFSIEKPAFIPVEIKFTVESQEEANALYCIFNHAGIVEFFDNKTYLGVCNSIRKEMYTVGFSLGYGKMWDDLLDALRK